MESAVCSITALSSPCLLYTSSDAHVDIHIDGAAFVDSLGYMLKGMIGIFLVIAIIMAVIMILNKVTGKEKKEA